MKFKYARVCDGTHFQRYECGDYITYLYMNWGWSGDWDGWFYFTSLFKPNPDPASTTEYDSSVDFIANIYL